MSDEHFLARWSRRKHEAALDQPAQAEQAAPATKPEVAGRDEAHAPLRGEAGAATEPAPPAQAFDPASLPSLESITATTDISGFLAPGVPVNLAREALRRAWASDPAVRHFVGLQEYDWDFVTPGAIPGFGEIGAEHNVRELVAQVFGEGPHEPRKKPNHLAAEVAANPSRSVRRTGESAPAEPGDEPQVAAAAVGSPEELLHRKENAAAQSEEPVAPAEQRPRRTHGGALPKT